MPTGPVPTSMQPRRLLALDAFRGATILAMVLVNNPGTWDAMYWPLGHAEWHGWTPTDLIFPFFLFIMGTSLAYSHRKFREGTEPNPAVYGKIVRRTIVLFSLGLLIALFGRFCDLVWRNADGWHLESLRILGVLQRIALVYLATSLLVLHIRFRGQVAIVIVILLGYWGLLTKLPPNVDPADRMSTTGNVVRQVDLSVLGAGHMYTQATSEPTEPEGLLSTLPAIATALWGYWCGLLVQRQGANWRTVAMLLAAGLMIAALGQVWNVQFPINKKLWTSSFVLLTGGLAAVGLGICLAVFDVAGWRRLARPLEIVGVNAILIYVGSGLLARLIGAIPYGDGNLQQWLYATAFTNHIANPPLASLGFALATVTLWWLVAAAMAKVGWSIRV